jgi:hypothetical protein
MIDRTAVAAVIVRRGLTAGAASPPVLPDDRLSDFVPGYPSVESKRLLEREVHAEIAAMWPGLRVDVNLRDDSTVRDIVQEIARHLGAWFGE